MKIEYWLIYADEDSRKAKPFPNIKVLERYIERKKSYYDNFKN